MDFMDNRFVCCLNTTLFGVGNWNRTSVESFADFNLTIRTCQHCYWRKVGAIEALALSDSTSFQDQGYDPCRSSPSDQSPGIIKPRRIPMLSTILFGVTYGERSHTTTFTESGANLYTNVTIVWSALQELNPHQKGRSLLYYPLY